ncbi:unnamed protein product [Prorocentrum cordatum]|uniref:Uncharacterized protein n=1 Tax=Prorocentrum cordatum TaxID=2364126 RepID=A0ABN9T923_9DINO|nr:unnamed protein product [Polarella glacialis]
MALAHGTRDAPVFERAFDEYERLAGLRLHRGKTVWVPLSLVPTAVARALLHRLAESSPCAGTPLTSASRWGLGAGKCLGPSRWRSTSHQRARGEQ